MTLRALLRTGVGTAAAVIVLAGPVAGAQAGIGPARAAERGAQAYVYGLPLMEFLRVRATMTSVACPDSYGNAPINTFSITPGFARPQDRTVVAPNVDTLYSVAHLDLGDGPVVLSHPDMGSRYFVFQFLDPYTNTLAYVGSRTTGSSAGRFAITWSGAPGSPVPGTTPVTVEHRRIWVIGRTLAGDLADQQAALGLMRQFTLSAPGGATPPADCKPGDPVAPPRRTGLGFLDALSAAMEDNPPPARDAAILARLKTIGVGPGLRVADAGLSRAARSALSASVRTTARELPQLVAASRYGKALTGRGWTAPPATIGDYGTDYVSRAGVAIIGLGANTPEEAAYTTAFLDNRGRRLHGRHVHRLRFAPGNEPPAGAFWSATVYDEDGFLVDAPVRRHAVGTSHPPLVRRPDGSVDIIFSQDRPDDPHVNWLPVPPARFDVYLRIYVPAPNVLNGAWRPPAIERLRG